MRFSIRNILLTTFASPVIGGIVGYVLFVLTVDWIGRAPALWLVAVIAAIVGIIMSRIFPWHTKEH